MMKVRLKIFTAELLYNNPVNKLFYIILIIAYYSSLIVEPLK